MESSLSLPVNLLSSSGFCDHLEGGDRPTGQAAPLSLVSTWASARLVNVVM